MIFSLLNGGIFYDGSGIEIGRDYLVPSGGTASITWSESSYDSSYSWYIIVDDQEFATQPDTGSFITTNQESLLDQLFVGDI